MNSLSQQNFPQRSPSLCQFKNQFKTIKFSKPNPQKSPECIKFPVIPHNKCFNAILIKTNYTFLYKKNYPRRNPLIYMGAYKIYINNKQQKQLLTIILISHFGSCQIIVKLNREKVSKKEGNIPFYPFLESVFCLPFSVILLPCTFIVNYTRNNKTSPGTGWKGKRVKIRNQMQLKFVKARDYQSNYNSATTDNYHFFIIIVLSLGIIKINTFSSRTDTRFSKNTENYVFKW